MILIRYFKTEELFFAVLSFHSKTFLCPFTHTEKKTKNATIPSTQDPFLDIFLPKMVAQHSFARRENKVSGPAIARDHQRIQRLQLVMGTSKKVCQKHQQGRETNVPVPAPWLKKSLDEWHQELLLVAKQVLPSFSEFVAVLVFKAEIWKSLVKPLLPSKMFLKVKMSLLPFRDEIIIYSMPGWAFRVLLKSAELSNLCPSSSGG